MSDLQNNPQKRSMRNRSDDVFRTVEVAGRSWEIVLHPQAAFIQKHTYVEATSVMVLGFSLTAIIAYAVAHILIGRRKLQTAQATLEHRVEERTVELSNALESLTSAHVELVRMENSRPWALWLQALRMT